MNKLEIEEFCKDSPNLKHSFELFVLPSFDVNYQCTLCDYKYLHVVEKPEWLLKQADEWHKKKNNN